MIGFRVLCAVTVASVTGMASACLWDYDTLAAETNGLPELRDVIAGRFDVNPPEYYEKRIDLMEGKRAGGSLALDDYDNAAMAHDRLGHTKEAYAWLDAKLARLEKVQPKVAGDDWYRFYANRGTVYSHDWSRQGMWDADPGLLEKALADLKKALADAHFGRETVQVEILKLARSYGSDNYPKFGAWETYVTSNREAAQKGVIGIMSLGIGWNNPDLYALLASTVSPFEAVTKDALLLRAQQFEDAGQKGWLTQHDRRRIGGGGRTEDGDNLKAQVAILTANGDRYRASRQEFIKEQMAAGAHPDKDADFWTGLPEVPRAQLPGWEPRVILSYLRANLANVVLGVVCGGPLLALGLISFFRSRKLRRLKAMSPS